MNCPFLRFTAETLGYKACLFWP